MGTSLRVHGSPYERSRKSRTGVNFTQYYDLERYLFTEVTARFQRNGTLNAFDFFCIVIWKANRAKSKIASRLLAKNNHGDLREAVSELIQAIRQAETAEKRLRVLIVEWKLRLPMASAILSVFYPAEFTVYDVRVCQQLAMYRTARRPTPPSAKY